VVIGASATGWAHFQVASKPSATSVGLTFLGYPGDQAPTTTLAVGSVVSPSGRWGLPAPLTVYAAGTAYSLTATSALLALGTTTPSLAITTAGTYLLKARARIDYGGAAVTANRVVTLKLRRTAVAAADIAGATAGFKTAAITTEARTAAIVSLPEIVYTTALATDVIQLWGGVDTLDAVDNLKAVEAEIIAVRLF
jgi:hypothetical protein